MLTICQHILESSIWNNEFWIWIWNISTEIQIWNLKFKFWNHFILKYIRKQSSLYFLGLKIGYSVFRVLTMVDLLDWFRRFDNCEVWIVVVGVASVLLLQLLTVLHRLEVQVHWSLLLEWFVHHALHSDGLELTIVPGMLVLFSFSFSSRSLLLLLNLSIPAHHT